jgi:hypothetical protein
MTYQRNISIDQFSLLPEQEPLYERLEREVGQPEIGTDDRAGEDHDHRAGQDLTLVRPLDLLQLGGGLGDEAPTAASRAPATGLRLRGLLRRADLLLARAGTLRDALGLGGGDCLLLPTPFSLSSVSGQLVS